MLEGTAVLWEDFLSTLSLRRATIVSAMMRLSPSVFYPRSPCGERLQRTARHEGRPHFSIHALLAESDGIDEGTDQKTYLFLSTLSLRRATKQLGVTPDDVNFLSTLSLRRATARRFPPRP